MNTDERVIEFRQRKMFQNPGASGGDHQTPERAATSGPPASMRRVVSLKCQTCTHEWTAPALGRCPKCHDEFVVAVSEHDCVLKRV